MFSSAFLVGAFAIGSYAQASSSAVGGFGGFGSSSTSPTTSGPPVAAQTTLNLFLDGNDSEQWIGSIVAFDSCETTIALACTEGTYGSGVISGTCNPSATAVATYGPNFFELSTQAEESGVQVTLVESCSLAGTTSAVCMVSIGASAQGKKTATKTTVTKSGGDVNFVQVPITAGASKLAAKTTCASGAAAPTGAIDIVKVLVVPGAAALLAGIHAFA